MLVFKPRVLSLTCFLWLSLFWFPVSMWAQSPQLEQSTENTEPLPAFIARDLEQEVTSLLPADGARIGYLPLLIADQSPLSAYYSRFLPQILLSRIPELEERMLGEEEQVQLVHRAAQGLVAREIEAFHTHVRQGSRTGLAGNQFIPSVELEERARLVSQTLTSKRVDELFSQGIDWIPAKVRLALAPPITERNEPVPESIQVHLRTILDWLGNEERTITPSIPTLFNRSIQNESLEPRLTWAFSQLHKYLEQQNLTYTLVGSLDFFGSNNEFGIVEYWIYSVLSRSMVFSGRFTFASRSGPEVAQEESRAVALGLTGQERGIVRFTTFPPTTEVRVAGRTLGFGTILWDMAPVGTHEVQFVRGTKVAKTQMVQVGLEETTNLIVSLPPEPVTFVPLETNPPGAQVSFNGVGLGTTPLLVPIRSGPGILEIRSPGFHSRTLVVDQHFRTHGGSLTLLDGRIDWDARLSQTRDRFYVALGATVLSAAVPLILNGLFGDAAVAFQTGEGTPQARANLFDQATQLFWIRNGSYLLTAVAATYTLSELQNYLRTARAVLSR